MEQEFTVSKLSNLIKRSLETNFNNIKVTAEVSALKIAASGHAYFALKDEEAIIDTICWRSTLFRSKYKLTNGDKITCFGKVSSYPMQSKYQFIIDKFEPAGMGNLLQIIEERKQKLAKEGLFDINLKKPIPKFPKIIGVITSPTGAVIQDIIHRVRQRFPTQILLWPVLVQGTEAANQIEKALNGMNSLPIHQRPDILIIARGGGSFEDLMPFNEENIIRAVFRSKIPVISAVGHETDTTLIDYVSDLRAPTPTAAAELATPDQFQIKHAIEKYSFQLSSSISHILKTKKLRFKATGTLNVNWILSDKKQRLDIDTEKLIINGNNFISKIKVTLANIQIVKPTLCYNVNELAERLNKLFLELILNKKMKISQVQLQKPIFNYNLKELEERLTFSFVNKLNSSKHRLELSINSLESSSYINILRKGFIWAETRNNKSITTKEEAKKLSSFLLNFADGSLEVYTNNNR